MGAVRDLVNQQESGEKLDRWVAEEIFGFKVREAKTLMLKDYIQVIGEDAEEPFCPLCCFDEVDLWIPDQLKPYSLIMDYAMKVAEKTKLFTKYQLRQKTNGRWSVSTMILTREHSLMKPRGICPQKPSVKPR